MRSVPDLNAPPEIRGQPVGHGDGAAALLNRRLPANPDGQLFYAARRVRQCNARFAVPCAGNAGDSGCRFPYHLHGAGALPVDDLVKRLSTGRGVVNYPLRIHSQPVCFDLDNRHMRRLARRAKVAWHGADPVRRSLYHLA